MSAPGRALAACTVLSVAGAVLAAGLGATPATSPVRRCADAVVIAGRLSCGPDAVVAWSCPQRERPAPGSVIGAHCRVAADPALMRALELTVDVNTGSAVALASLPGIGPTLARRIIADRPFERPEDLRRVRGIGAVTLAAIAPRVKVSAHPGPTRVAPATTANPAHGR